MLWFAVLGSAVQVIYARHKARDMFVRLEKLNSQRDSLEIEWGRLQLEQSYWSSTPSSSASRTRSCDEPAANPGCADRPAVKQRPSESSTELKSYRWRSAVILGLVVCGAVGLGARAVELQLIDHGFLAKQGDDRSMRVVKIAAHRGAITDRSGEPLAVSTPVDTVWVNPQELNENIDQLPKLAKALKQDQQLLARRITSNLDREFLYLERHMPPEEAARIKALGIPGVYLLREYRRYYPAGEVAGHVVGFTNLDDQGQEGLELGFEQLLNGEDGAKRVIQDLYGHQVENVESIRAPRPGRDLVTSIDLRIQYLAYRELKAAMQDYRAKAGSVIVIDVDTGEVLAMVNQPSYNPNDRDQLKAAQYRNRAATDIFEPGSSIKPFIMAAALASGQYRPDSVVDTSPGFVQVGNKVFEDEHDLGRHRSRRPSSRNRATSAPPRSPFPSSPSRSGRPHRPRVSGRSPAANSRANRRACSRTTRTGGPSASPRFPTATACR